MGALDNAARLGEDNTFKSWICAAAAYQARIVIAEDVSIDSHSVRKDLARTVLNNPRALEQRFTWIICTDPTVASRGATPTLVTEQVVIDKMAEVWTAVSKLNIATSA